jgi:hypothetical protein
MTLDEQLSRMLAEVTLTKTEHGLRYGINEKKYHTYRGLVLSALEQGQEVADKYVDAMIQIDSILYNK